ncbi:MAG: discoidin domain-containing protein [Paludibacter sp.]|nr:discoidin domain-containing protein [Paludibacter sp.]
MKTKKLLSLIFAAVISLGFLAKGESHLISRMPTNGVGKQIVSIHSFSALTRTEEGATNLLLPDMSSNEDKWCDNSSAQPWVIFELSNYYDVDKFVITDARIRELDNGNIAEYKIFVTDKAYDEVIGGWEDTDWTEVAYRTGEGDSIIKTVQLDAPVKARYVKFLVLDKGVRADNGNPENAVRVYGFDIYGTYDSAVDRGDLISVGKTVLATEDAVSKRETGINIIDGNKTNMYDKWCFGSYGEDINQRYTIIDLEGLYDISDIKIYDANFLETGTLNMQGCNIYVSRYAPDLSLINMYNEDSNDCWTKVVDSNYEDAEDIKDYPLTGVMGRFVKIEIPYDKAGDPTSTSRIFEAEVYGTPATVSSDDATLSLLSVSKGSMSPKFSGDVTEYTVNVDKEIESITISASATSSKATVTGAGEQTLNIGENTFEINVTAEDGTHTKKYTVVVNRAAKSKIATLKSLSCNVGFFSPDFVTDSLHYFVDAPFGTEKVTISAEATEANAQISGLGEQTLTDTETVFDIVVTAEDGTTTKTYTMTVDIAPDGLISVNYGLPAGKRIVNIHSYSAKSNDTESPYKLLLGERLNTNGSTGNKWCDNSSAEPWVIFSLTDIYKINRIVIRDGQTIESSAVNISGYDIAVSTTGTADEDFVTVAGEFTDGENTIDVDWLGDNARYIKLTLYKGINDDSSTASAVWIYGVDIYGTKSENVDRGNLISVGKTVVSASSYASDRETPCNLLDGNVSYITEDQTTYELDTIKCDPWAFSVENGDAYAIIDLEQTYSVDSFKVYDKEDWLKGYKVYVNTTGSDADWTEVYSGTYTPDSSIIENDDWTLDTIVVGPDPKIAKLDAPVNARFVKLEVPVEMQSDGWNRLREFEIYGGEPVSGFNIIKSDAESLVVYPNPVNQGGVLYLNETGNLKIYTLQGSLVFDKYISGATRIPTTSLAEGSYILKLRDSKSTKQAKLIVK